MTINTQLAELDRRSRLHRAFHASGNPHRSMFAARLVRREAFIWEPRPCEIALRMVDGRLLCADCVTEHWHSLCVANRLFVSNRLFVWHQFMPDNQGLERWVPMDWVPLDGFSPTKTCDCCHALFFPPLEGHEDEK